MSNTNICIRIDKDLKKQFDGICSELGMSMSTAINIFAKAFVNNNGMPFDVKLNIPNEETQKAISDVKNNIGLSKEYSNLDEMFEDLNA